MMIANKANPAYAVNRAADLRLWKKTERSGEMGARQAMQCPKCGSTNTKANFLGIPRVFGLSPNIVGGLWLAAGILIALSGLLDVLADRSVEVIVGVVLAAIAVLALWSRKYRCLDCKARFNFGPPSATERLAKAVKLEAKTHFQEALQEYNNLAKDFPDSPEAKEARQYASDLTKRMEGQA